ncbi:3'-5' exonuclease [Shewanella sp.]|uniref:3'-5' exonuclease n=1 Tax=Shewanella sp. TaxID=50422 RepID=UPI003A96D4C5
MKYDNVTIDLETLDTKTSAKILSIGIVPFNFNENVSFAELCSRESSLYIKINQYMSYEFLFYQQGFTESESTRHWWEKQGDAAKHVLDEDFENDLVITDALEILSKHLEKYVKPLIKDGGHIYCRGYDFDGGILNHHYSQLQMQAPWQYNRFRCIRTFIDALARTRNGYIKGDNPAGFIKHHALHDAAADTLTMINIAMDAIPATTPQ